MIPHRVQQSDNAFTLIEMLVVITIIIVLMGLAFPAFQGVQNAAKKTQAKNDLVQIVTAVNAFYTEYGKYPLGPSAGGPADPTFKTDNSKVIDVLRNNLRTANSGLVAALNPRQIVFITVPDVKSATTPKAGVDSNGIYWDPWGKVPGKTEAGVYHIAIDGDYDNLITPNAYSSGAGADPLAAGVIAWSVGKDGSGGSGDKNATLNKDDVISWQ